MGKAIFSHLAITCEDPIKMEQWYVKYFGFERVRVYEPGEQEVTMIRMGSMCLELFPASEKSPIAPPQNDGYGFRGVRHICFSVDDLDEKLNELGDDAQISLGPLDMGKYIPGMRVAFVKDPDGNILELNQGYMDELNPPVMKSDLEVVINHEV